GDVVRASFETHPFAEFRRDTLLGRLQSDVLDDLAPLQHDVERPVTQGGADWPRKQVDVSDPSLQFHACHTRLREVQVLHDQLRALLEADASLQPREIAVLAPDIDAYAPHIAAVFGGAQRERFIPYGISETGTLSAVPLAAALLRLCTLDREPVTPADIRDLLGVPAVAARFGLQGDAMDAISHWLDEAGARWGLDADDRARHGAPPQSAYTLQFAIDRLLFGYAAGEPMQIAGTAAWPGIEGRDSDVLDGLLRLLALLRDFARELARPQTPQRWAAVLDRLLVALVGEEPAGSDDQADERQALLELRRLLRQFGDSASLADFTQRIEPDILLQYLRQEIARPDLRAPLLSGGVAFGRMVPMRLIPFKAIALLGMDANAFPARDPRGAVDRIAAGLDSSQRRVGDPSHRDADRYLFLQLLTCAEQVF
ncbi:MAG TPA: exodeoxyribonuclease V subunit gamma, partial [Xanthomonadaceae bacterium]|nr:exodeoxyribonuclease V subunit gamma [Xanthomonadaceae bacterium]